MPNVLHPAWEKIPPYMFFNLAPRFILERGIDYWIDERVTDLNLDRSTGKVTAKVRGSSVYSVSIEPGRNNIVTQCTCPAFARNQTCKHVAAVAAAFFHCTHGSTYGRKPPAASYTERLRESLVQSQQIVPQANSAEETDYGAKPHPSGEAVPYLEVSIHDTGLIGIGWQVEPSMMDEKTVALIERHRWLFGDSMSDRWGLPIKDSKRIQRLMEDCAREGFDVVFEGNGMRVAIDPTGIPGYLGAVLFEDLSADEENVREFTYNLAFFDESRKPHKIIFMLENEPIAFSDKGELLRVQNADYLIWPRLFSANLLRNVGDARWQQKRYSSYLEDEEQPGWRLSETEFKMESLGCSLNASDWADSELFVATPSGAIVPVSDLPITGELVPIINVERKPDSDSLIDGPRIHIGALDGTDIIDSEALHAQLAMTLDLSGVSRAFFTAKGRKLAIRDLLLESLHEGTANKLAEALDAIDEHPAFANKEEHATHAKRILQRVAKDWPLEAHSILLPPTVEGGDWRRVSFNRAQFIATACAMLPDEAGVSFGKIFQQRFTKDQPLAAILARASLAAAVGKGKIRIDGRMVERERVDIGIHAFAEEEKVSKHRSNTEIDWFELRPEVKCGKFTIKPEDWGRLLRGELILQNDDGSIVVPDLEDEVLREFLGNLLPKNHRRSLKKGQPPLRVNRLQIFSALELRRHGATVTLPPEIEATYQSLQNFDLLKPLEVPTTIEATLRDYQKQAVTWLNFLYEHRFGACLADDMGLGKTIQAITFLAVLRERRLESPAARRAPHRPHLVVMPTSLIFNWQNELKRFCPEFSVAAYVGQSRNWAKASQYDIVLTTYDTLRIDKNRIAATGLDVLILDEVQAAKNLFSARYRALTSIKPRFTLCLTGTPMENHIGEYYAIMQLAVPGLLGSYREFNAEAKRGHASILRRVRPFILRRTKSAILKELPPKQETEVYLEMTDLQKEVYTRTVAEVREEVHAAFADQVKQKAGIAALSALLRLRQACIAPELISRKAPGLSPKFRYVLETLEELNAEGHSVLIFSSFARALDMIVEHARKRDLPILQLDGSTPAPQRRVAVEAFQSSEEPVNFFISLKAGGSGLNLTRASYVLHLDPWWNPAAENQASDRAHRIGQTQRVTIQRLIMRHTIEEKIMFLKERKKALFNDLVDNAGTPSRSTSSAITREDFAFLLDSDEGDEE